MLVLAAKAALEVAAKGLAVADQTVRANSPSSSRASGASRFDGCVLLEPQFDECQAAEDLRDRVLGGVDTPGIVAYGAAFHILRLQQRHRHRRCTFRLTISALLDSFKDLAKKDDGGHDEGARRRVHVRHKSVKTYADETGDDEVTQSTIHMHEMEAKAVERLQTARLRTKPRTRPTSAALGLGYAATGAGIVAALASLGGPRVEVPHDAAGNHVVREIRGGGVHSKLWHPRASEGGGGDEWRDPSSFGHGVGVAYVGNAFGRVDLLEVGVTAGALASRTERELHAHASLAAHLGALMATAWPAHAAARAHLEDAKSSFESDAGTTTDARFRAMLGVDANDLRRTSADPASELVLAFEHLAASEDGALGLSSPRTTARKDTFGGLKTSYARGDEGEGTLHSALSRLMPDFAEGVDEARRAAPAVFAACMPSPDAPLRAAAAALGAKGEEPLAVAARHVDAADAVAARLGATRARLESLHTEEPEAARAAVDAALGAARDPCAVAGTIAALHCGALKAGITRWGETMTGVRARARRSRVAEVRRRRRRRGRERLLPRFHCEQRARSRAQRHRRARVRRDGREARDAVPRAMRRRVSRHGVRVRRGRSSRGTVAPRRARSGRGEVLCCGVRDARFVPNAPRLPIHRRGCAFD